MNIHRQRKTFNSKSGTDTVFSLVLSFKEDEIINLMEQGYLKL